ncbi:hypothetical protein QMA60_07870 [Leuconostoc suionicum]|uniref:hypothetical protein n=1 Tax=Leuconostoc suionicum TaxID=1511761 RepID=UPI0019B7ECC6|nr:hypothetical protein [Leuconostoc suionicum]MBC9720844.1 hypothetical protein [Lactobacillus sp.]MDI6498551.1 hypothetical protein [Leuconostoc suionicum]MDI6500593.1 hypothetical protein [Leuconostoc suionicum]MDI6502755.1 hypothetical protein [Leuconostoc suionicum]MDI6613911.1 hypothetical protein [Leuconostoc suionicum]
MIKQPFKITKTIGAVALISMSLLNYYANFQFNYTKYGALIVTLMMIVLGFQSYSEKKKFNSDIAFVTVAGLATLYIFFIN